MNNFAKTNAANFVSAFVLLFTWLAIIFLLKGFFYLSFSLILLAFVFDAIDGYLARVLKIDDLLGRTIDGYVDVVNYLVYPAIALFTYFKMTSVFSLIAIFVFVAAGIFRLARFEVRGIKRAGEKMYYEGLPVFFSPILILIFLLASQFLKGTPLNLFLIMILLLASFLMVQTFKFPKPKNILPVVLVALILSLIFFVNHFSITW